MRVLIAFDKFKDALAADEACTLAAGVLGELHGNWQIECCPLTDGGEGLCAILTRALGGQLESHVVTGPRGEPVHAPLGWVRWRDVPPTARELLALPRPLAPDDKIALVEMASASGLALLPPAQRDPWQTTSRGTGDLLQIALSAGARAILVGVGGSATNDLGLGALEPFGVRLVTRDGANLGSTVPAHWRDVVRIVSRPGPHPVPIRIACDVTNPLLGPHGCTAVYGPQKGLAPGEVAKMEAQAARIAQLLCEATATPAAAQSVPGAGAAGGIAFGLGAALGARLLGGFALVDAWLGLEEKLRAADLVITGEGAFDATSLTGKGCGALALRAATLGKRVHVFAGRVAVKEASGLQMHAITPASMPLAEALPRASVFLSHALKAAFA